MMLEWAGPAYMPTAMLLLMGTVLLEPFLLCYQQRKEPFL